MRMQSWCRLESPPASSDLKGSLRLHAFNRVRLNPWDLPTIPPAAEHHISLSVAFIKGNSSRLNNKSTILPREPVYTFRD